MTRKTYQEHLKYHEGRRSGIEFCYDLILELSNEEEEQKKFPATWTSWTIPLYKNLAICASFVTTFIVATVVRFLKHLLLFL